MFGSRDTDRMGKYNEVPLYSDSSESDDDDDFVRNHLRKQQQQLEQQDKGLEMLSQSAERLGQLSMNIHEELGQQNKMLDDMESDLDKASTRLDIVTAKTRELIKRSGGVKYFLIIVVLTLVMLFLFFLVIYF